MKSNYNSFFNFGTVPKLSPKLLAFSLSLALLGVWGLTAYYGPPDDPVVNVESISSEFPLDFASYTAELDDTGVSNSYYTISVTNESSPGANDGSATITLNGHTTFTYWFDLRNESNNSVITSSGYISNLSHTFTNLGTSLTYKVSVYDFSALNPHETSFRIDSVSSGDVTPPTPLCQNISVFLDGTGSASITAADIDGGSTDDVAIDYMEVSESSFTCANIGANSVRLRVFDTSANVDSCTATVTVIDTVSPSAIAQDVSAYLDGSGSVTITAADIDNGSSDNCGTPSLSLDITTFTCADTGVNVVTLTTTDGSANTATAMANVTVIDTISPTIDSCPSNIAENSVPGDCSALVTWSPPTGSDNCDSDLAFSTTAPGITVINQGGLCVGLFPVGTTTVTHTFTDDSGNSATCEFDITVSDVEDPVFAGCPTDITVQAPAGTCETTATWNAPTASDNCPGVTTSTTHLPGATFAFGTTEVVYVATDASGNKDTCRFNVIVEDVEAPVAAASNFTAYLDASGNVSILASDVESGSTDNCSVDSMAVSPSSFTCAELGANTVTLTVWDVARNSNSTSATVTVEDTVSPTAIAQNLTVYLDGTGNVSITAADTDGGSADNCSVASLALNTSSFSCSDIGSNLVELTVTDNSGNSSTASATVTVHDTVSPSVSTQNITVYLDGSGNASITAADIDNGSSDNCSVASLAADITSFTCSDLGANTVALTVTDGSSNMSTANATVTVVDSTSPTAVAQNITVYLDGAGSATLVAADIDGGSSDNCSVASLSADITSFSCADVGANTVELTVTDGSSNMSTAQATVTVMDTISPTAVVQNLTVYLDGTGNVSITAADVDNGSSDNCSVASLALNTSSFSCSDIGSNLVELTVTDNSGNSSTASATVTVHDTVSPSVSTQNITVYLDGSGNASITAADIDNGSSDNCSVASLAADITSFTCSDLGANTVALTVTDGSSNMSTANATVTVVDSTSPTAVAQNITVYLDGAGSATIVAADIDGGSSDNCSVASLSADITSFSCADVGANTVELTVTDGSSNMSTAQATVTVMDTISPTAVVQNLTVYLDGTGNVSITAADVDNGSSDNCSIDTMTLDISSFTCAEVGANTVELTVTDVNENSSTANATVTVADTISPTVVTQNITAYLDASGNVSITTGDIDNGSSDNCGISSMSLDISSFTCAEVGANTVELTVNDVNSNSSSATATVTVVDTISPTAVAQNVTVYLDGAGSASITTGDIDNGSSDNCAIDNLSLDITSFTCADVGANTVELTVNDVNGNSNMANATVTVMDTISPTVATQNITAYLDGTGNVSITAAEVDNGSSDNCSIDTMTLDISSFTCAEVGANTVELTVTDVNENSSTANAMVTVADTISPTVVTQNITAYLDASGNVSITTGAIDNGSSDNCGINSMSLDISSFTCAEVGANTVELTVNDVNSNSSSATATVTVVDTISPNAVTQNVTVYLDGAGSASITTGDIDNGSSDNCGIDNMSLDITSFTCADVGANTVVLTVNDVNGNSSMANATVTVMDTISPTVATQNITAYLDGTGNVSITAADVDNGSSDNCSIDTMTLDISSFTCAEVGANTIELTVTDVNGNSHSASATVTVEDTIAPTVVTQDITAYLDASGLAFITAADVDGGSSDACGIDMMGLNDTNFGCGDIGANTVTLTVTDIHGNSSMAMATVTVADSTAPTPIANDITVQLDASGNASINTSDIEGASSDNCGVASSSLDITSFSCADTGANTVTLSVTDVNGNVATTTATVTVEDTIAPVAIAQDITVQLDSAGQILITTADIDNGSSDNCSVSLSLDIMAFDCEDIGANPVVLTATDASGNTHSANATVTVEDNIAPVIVIRTDTLMVALDSSGNATIDFPDIDVASYDNCFGLPIILGPQVGANATTGSNGVGVSSNAVNANGIDTAYLSVSSFTCTDLGLNEVILTVVDSMGNSSKDTTYVMVVDSVAPMLTCPANIVVSNDSATCGAVVSYSVPYSDNCTVDTFYQTAGIASGMEFPVGTTTNTFVVTDESGNTSTCSFTVTVNDTEAPVISYPSIPTLMSNDPDLNSLVQTWIDSISVTDNCACPGISDSLSIDTSAAWINIPAGGSDPDTLSKTYMVSANDCNGNNTTESRELRILEPKPMVVTCDLEDWGGSSLDPFNHALYIYDSPIDPTRSHGNDTEYQRFLWDSNGGTLTILNDTAAVIRGMVYSKVDTSAKFNVFIDMNIPEDWTGWEALGGGYHVPLDPTQAAVTHAMHMDWRYWELGPDSRLEGVGSIAGTLYLTQAPDPTSTPWGDRYRVQEGEGANDKDADEGVSGWFFFNGTVTYGGQTLNLDSKGDVNADVVNSDTTYGAPVVSPFITALSSSSSQTQEGEGAVSLAWVSEVPFNEGKVTVERSVDGTIYEEVATIEENETGEKQEPVRFVDTNVDGALKYYYRIKVENADGSFYYTQTFEVLLDEVNESSIEIFPNPASEGFVDVFVLHPENKVHSYQILDMKGSILRAAELRANQLTRISLKDMPMGIYMIQVIKPNGELDVHKIQVE